MERKPPEITKPLQTAFSKPLEIPSGVELIITGFNEDLPCVEKTIESCKEGDVTNITIKPIV